MIDFFRRFFIPVISALFHDAERVPSGRWKGPPRDDEGDTSETKTKTKHEDMLIETRPYFSFAPSPFSTRCRATHDTLAFSVSERDPKMAVEEEVTEASHHYTAVTRSVSSPSRLLQRTHTKKHLKPMHDSSHVIPGFILRTISP